MNKLNFNYQAGSDQVQGTLANGQIGVAKKETKRSVSEQQLLHRERFTQWSKTISTLFPILSVGYRTYGRKRNLIIGEVTKLHFNKEVIPDTYPITINYDKIMVSKGSLLPLSSLSQTYSSGVLSYKWRMPQQKLNGDESDLVYLALYYPELGQLEISAESVKRSDLGLSFVFDQDLPASRAHCYLFLASTQNSAVSNSYYFEVPNFKV